MATEMKAVLQYRASPRLRQRLRELDLPTVVVDEFDKDGFRRELRDAEILLHVLEPVTATAIEAAPPAPADPEDRRRRQYDRPRCRPEVRSGGLQYARDQHPGSTGNDPSADAGDTAPAG
jgi:hypothetical protein